jgi:hypothetical protein
MGEACGTNGEKRKACGVWMTLVWLRVWTSGELL